MYEPQQRVKFCSSLYWRELALEGTGRADAGAASQDPVPQQEGAASCPLPSCLSEVTVFSLSW